MSRNIAYSFIAALALVSTAAHAGYTCYGGATLSADQRSCSDGGIPVFVADVVEPAKPASPAQQATPSANNTAPAATTAARDNNDLRYFYRGWALFVPGAAYQVPSHLMDYNKIVVSPGTGVLHKLQINANKTFRWDGKRGRWQLNGNGEIVLVKAYEGKNWSVVRNTQDGGIYVMDGSTWFQAKD